MSQYDDTEIDFDIDDDEFDSFDDGSKLLKKLRRELSQTKKALKERGDELSSLKTETRKRTVRDVLSANGLNPKIAAFIPSDIEPDEGAINAWINEYGDVFGIAPVSSEGQAVNASVDASAIRRMSVAEDAGVASDFSNDIANLIEGATSREELQSILRNA